jgi:hypothetical protein
MAKKPLFTDDRATDTSYINIRAAKNEFTRAGRENCEALWEMFEPHADREFLIEIRKNFDARYWEMYLTTFFVREGYKVTCPKPGPDVGIEFCGRRIWFEATSPSRGQEGKPDQVPAIKPVRLGDDPVVSTVPNEKIVLRYLNSISEKQRQYASWLRAGTVSAEDAFVIAINPKQLGHELADSSPPRILQAAFQIGAPYLVIDQKTAKTIGAGYQFRDKIAKAAGKPVSTGVFLQDDSRGLSGLLCSRIDAVNQPVKMGDDFQLVPNPRATFPLPRLFRLKGTFFRIERAEGEYIAVSEAYPWRIAEFRAAIKSFTRFKAWAATALRSIRKVFCPSS